MEGVAGIASRISDIQSRIAQLSPPVSTATPVPGATPPSATTFRSALDDALVAQGARTWSTGPTGTASSTGTTSSTRTTGSTAGVGAGKDQLDAKGVPSALRTYGNGKVPSHALSEVGDTGHRLWAPAAESAEAMRRAAARDGVTIGITDSYRTYETQVDLVRRKGLYSQGGLAAVPGTSMHGWGMALDLRLDATAQAWMRENGGRFGFVEDTPREPWHWGYHPTH